MDVKLIINHLSFIIRKSRGFTLIELLVAISIMALLGILSIAGFINYNQSQVLQTSASEVATMLNLAKSRAQSQIKPPELCPSGFDLDGYSVRIAPLGIKTRYMLQLKCSGIDVMVREQDKRLPSKLEFTSSATFFFPVQTGRVEASGPEPWRIMISDSRSGKTRTITVNSLGGISVQ